MKCVAGKWSEADSTLCNDCPKGFHSDLVESSACTACEAGRFSLTEANSKDAETACTKCDAGRYSSAKGVTKANDCNACAAGKKNPMVGSTNSGDCTDCDAMSKSDSGSPICHRPLRPSLL